MGGPRHLSNESRQAARRETMRRWRAANKEHTAEYNRKYREENPELVTAASLAWREANKERHAATTKAWRQAHPERVRAWNRMRFHRQRAGGDLTTAEWEAILEDFDHTCAYCQDGDVFLEIEHVIPVSRGGRHTKSNVVPACGTCNREKGVKTALEFRMRVS